MSPSIGNLPLEVTLTVLEYLNPFDILAVLRTFNKALYRAAQIAFQSYEQWTRNAKRMTALFPPQSTHRTRRLCPSYPGHIPPFCDEETDEEIPRKDYDKLSLDPKGGPYIRCSPPDLITWMNLDGSFEWLKPLDKERKTATGGPRSWPVAATTKVDALTKKVSELNLTLPPGFEAFLRSEVLHHRVPSCSGWVFELSRLIKCPAAVDGGHGGYLCRFHVDSQFTAYSYLYLSPSGCHCVLESQCDFYEGMNDGEDSAVGVDFEKEDAWIRGLSFEEYLATVYYESLRGFEIETSEGRVRFVKHVYRSPAEVEHLRDTNEAIKVFLDAQKWKGTNHYHSQISD